MSSNDVIYITVDFPNSNNNDITSEDNSSAVSYLNGITNCTGNIYSSHIDSSVNDDLNVRTDGIWINNSSKRDDNKHIDILECKESQIKNNSGIDEDASNEEGQMGYSGNWKNGKPNGFGSLYRNGVIAYEGEWVDGILELEPSLKVDALDGCVRHYDENGMKRYEGDWENGNPNGKGKVYDEEGNEIYEGKWKNGILQVNAQMSYDYTTHCVTVTRKNGELKYHGEWKNGCPHGEGQFYIDNSVVYEGDWKKGRIHIEENRWFDYSMEKEFTRLAFKKPSQETKKRMILIGSILIIVVLLLTLLCVVMFPQWLSSLQLRYGKNITITSISELNEMNKNVRYLVFGDGCCQEGIEELEISNYPLLRELTIGKRSLSNVRKMILKSMIGNECLVDNPELNVLTTRDNSLFNTTMFLLEGKIDY